LNLRDKFYKNNTANKPANRFTVNHPLSGVADVFQMNKDSRMRRVAFRYPMKFNRE